MKKKSDKVRSFRPDFELEILLISLEKDGANISDLISKAIRSYLKETCPTCGRV